MHSHLYRKTILKLLLHQVAEELLPYTNFDAGEQGFPAPPREELRAVRVLVATSCSAARLLNAGLPRGHFAAVFVDEAGNAVEPEVPPPPLTPY
jgi:hypothetical protein